VDVQERSQVYSVVYESHKKMMVLVILLSESSATLSKPTDVRFITFTKIGSGMSYEDYTWIL